MMEEERNQSSGFVLLFKQMRIPILVASWTALRGVDRSEMVFYICFFTDTNTSTDMLRIVNLISIFTKERMWIWFRYRKKHI